MTQDDLINQDECAPADFRPLGLLLWAIALYVAFLVVFGRLPNLDSDEVWYKAAGKQWALSGRFAAPELTGVYGLKPPLQDVWLVYPPLYPMLFGVVVKLFGFGWRPCVAFDATIHAVLVIMTYLVAGRLKGRGNRWVALWSGLAVLVLAHRVQGRPDELAIACGMAGLLPLLPGPGRASPRVSIAGLVVSGGLLGLCGGTSVAAGIVLGLIALVLLMGRIGLTRGLIPAGLLWACSGALVLVALIAPLLITHPGAYRQYSGLMRVIFQSDTRSHWEKLVAILTIGRQVSLPVLGILGVGLATLLPAIRRGGVRRWLTLWTGPLLGVAFVLSLGSHTYTYVWYAGPYVIAATAVCLTHPIMASAGILRRLGLGLFVVLILYGSTDLAKQVIILGTLPREQTLQYNQQIIDRMISSDSYVWGQNSWWLIGQRCIVFDPRVPPELWSNVDYAVVGEEVFDSELAAQVRANFSPIFDNRSDQPRTFFGFTLSRSFKGFGMLVLRRRSVPGLDSSVSDGGRVKLFSLKEEN